MEGLGMKAAKDAASLRRDGGMCVGGGTVRPQLDAPKLL
jgi:hypothetical protein